ncbi:YfjI family protein [Escherichia coli]|uniref:YfjI family protein n=1 Tax=Escherichia coli TaxID=562 RepID=UPI002238556F|nr:YfjI family protein [Escherichia coli]
MSTERKTLKLAKKALGEWQENQIKIERKALAGGEWEHIRDIVLKAGSNILRIAGIFTCYCYKDAEEIESIALLKLCISWTGIWRRRAQYFIPCLHDASLNRMPVNCMHGL